MKEDAENPIKSRQLLKKISSMKHYYFVFEGGNEVSIPADSEMEAREKFRKMYPNSRVIKVWHA